MSDAKSNFSFSWLIIMSFLFLILDSLSSIITKLESHYHNKTIELLLEIGQKFNHNEKYFLLFRILSFLLIAISALLGTQQKKLSKNNIKTNYLYTSLILTFTSIIYFILPFLINKSDFLYFIFSFITYVVISIYLFKIAKYVNNKLGTDRFNKEARKFEQTKEKKENKYSINIKSKDGWVNIINPFRASMVLGTPGSGKTYVFLLEAIIQSMNKNYTMFVYDYKFPELTTFTYNTYIHKYKNIKNRPQFALINFDDIEYSNRSNPLQPDLLTDSMDAVESAKTVLNGLNKTWMKKEGDFFVESAINFFAIVIWALKLYDNGKYCSLPHAIELISKDYKSLFNFLMQFNDPFIKNVLEPFKEALKNETYEQLDGQIASARLTLTRLTSPTIYYVMTTGKDKASSVSLDINNPSEPKILCIGNNPTRKEIYGACISLYTTRMLNIINKKNKLPSAIIIDELPTLAISKGSLDNAIATGRSNLLAIWLGLQDLQQLIRDHGKENADAIFSTIGNIFSGSVKGETAKKLSEMFGKIKVIKESYSISKGSVNTSINEHLESLVTVSDLTTLSQGEFVGVVADNFGEEIEQKRFHSKMIIDNNERKKFNKYKLPKILNLDNSNLTKEKILEMNMKKIVNEISYIVELANKKIEEPL